MPNINYGGKPIAFQLRYSGRKSVEIAVHPGGEVLVRAPFGADEKFIMGCVYKRAGWISRQIQYFEQFEPRTPRREFVGGESHLYLGRKYRLKICRGDFDRILLKRGFFYIDAVDTAPRHIEALLDFWYRRKAEVVFQDALMECWRDFPRNGANIPLIRIRKMKTRWGSLSAKGAMTLNLLLIKAPPECIRYVVTHELCHLFHRGHGRDFYRLLESRLPDWRLLKHTLETTLS